MSTSTIKEKLIEILEPIHGGCSVVAGKVLYDCEEHVIDQLLQLFDEAVRDGLAAAKTERMCDQYPECGLTQWSCDRLQDIVYTDDTHERRELSLQIRKDMAELFAGVGAATTHTDDKQGGSEG